jgi:hypothetical protein
LTLCKADISQRLMLISFVGNASEAGTFSIE